VRDHAAEQARALHARVDQAGKDAAAALAPLARQQEETGSKLDALMREVRVFVPVPARGG